MCLRPKRRASTAQQPGPSIASAAPSLSPLDEAEQFGVDAVGVRDAHAVRQAAIDFQRSYFTSLAVKQRRVCDRTI
jgi:hypothetical protein